MSRPFEACSLIHFTSFHENQGGFPMADVSGFPLVEMQFDKNGNAFGPTDGAAAAGFVADNGLTDLFVFSHGWNNDMQDARALYRLFFADLRTVLDQQFPALS